MATNLGGLAAGIYLINRGHTNQNFVCDKIIISYIQTGLLRTISIYDSENTNGLTMDLPPSTGTIQNLIITPKLFKGDTLKIHLYDAIPVNEWLSIVLSGWYEDI